MAAGAAGLILGVLATLLGLHELSHRGQYDAPAPPEAGGDTAEFDPIGRAPAPHVRGRWS